MEPEKDLPEKTIPERTLPETAFPESTYHGRRWLELGVAAFFLYHFVMTLFDPVGSGLIRWFLTGAMGFNGLFFLRRALDSRPRLVIDAEGITDRTSLSGSTLFIPWAEVEAVHPTIGKKMVEVKVRDLDQTRRRTGWIRRGWLGLRRLWGKRTISIFLGVLGLEKGILGKAIEDGMIAHERRELGFALDRLGKGPGAGNRADRIGG